MMAYAQAKTSNKILFSIIVAVLFAISIAIWQLLASKFYSSHLCYLSQQYQTHDTPWTGASNEQLVIREPFLTCEGLVTMASKARSKTCTTWANKLCGKKQ